MRGSFAYRTQSVPPTSAEHARRYIAVRLLPFLFLLYIINCVDRTSVAYGAIEMARDLGFNDRVFSLRVGVFFLSYVALQIPGAVLAQRWSARGTICASMIVSGFLTALTAVVHTPAQLYLARSLLGAVLMFCAVATGIVVLFTPGPVRVLQSLSNRAKRSWTSAASLRFLQRSPPALVPTQLLARARPPAAPASHRTDSVIRPYS